MRQCSVFPIHVACIEKHADAIATHVLETATCSASRTYWTPQLREGFRSLVYTIASRLSDLLEARLDPPIAREAAELSELCRDQDLPLSEMLSALRTAELKILKCPEEQCLDRDSAMLRSMIALAFGLIRLFGAIEQELVRRWERAGQPHRTPPAEPSSAVPLGECRSDQRNGSPRTSLPRLSVAARLRVSTSAAEWRRARSALHGSAA
jgi:hypothetical protein